MFNAILTIVFLPDGTMNFHAQSNVPFEVLEGYLRRAQAEIARQIAEKASCPYAPAEVARRGRRKNERQE